MLLQGQSHSSKPKSQDREIIMDISFFPLPSQRTVIFASIFLRLKIFYVLRTKIFIKNRKNIKMRINEKYIKQIKNASKNKERSWLGLVRRG